MGIGEEQDIEAVRRAGALPVLHVVGDIFCGAGDHPVGADADDTLVKLADGQVLAPGHIDHHLLAARLLQARRQIGERAVEIETG